MNNWGGIIAFLLLLLLVSFWGDCRCHPKPADCVCTCPQEAVKPDAGVGDAYIVPWAEKPAESDSGASWQSVLPEGLKPDAVTPDGLKPDGLKPDATQLPILGGGPLK